MIEEVFVILLLLPGIFGWGKEGHYAICKIAQVKFLSFQKLGSTEDDFLSFLYS
jgi:hypothetical protein